MKLPYSEGSVVLVPLRNEGYARGVVARSSPTKQGLLFGYFFGPRLRPTDVPALDDLDPSKAILRVIFGDLGLINGEWKVVGRVPNWDRSKWSMPDFIRRDPLGGKKALLVRYSDADPAEKEAQHRINNDPSMPADAVSGYGAVELKLTKLLEQDGKA